VVFKITRGLVQDRTFYITSLFSWRDLALPTGSALNLEPVLQPERLSSNLK
jgi:hypothetical protein